MEHRNDIDLFIEKEKSAQEGIEPKTQKMCYFNRIVRVILVQGPC